MSDNGSNSDWIYLLLTLVAGALSLLKSQSAKKRPLARPASESPEIYDDIPDEGENAEGKETGLYGKHENPCFYSDPDSLSGISNGPCRGMELQTEEEEEEETDFNLRKAVISSEILKRKFD